MGRYSCARVAALREGSLRKSSRRTNAPRRARRNYCAAHSLQRPLQPSVSARPKYNSCKKLGTSRLPCGKPQPMLQLIVNPRRSRKRGQRCARSGHLKGRAFLVVAVYVASLVLVACGHCAPSFGFASIAQAEDSHHHDCDDHGHSGSAEDCPADSMAKGSVSARADVVEMSAAKSIAVLPTIQEWSKRDPLVTLPPERPPDSIPRAHSRYAQILARTGRMIV